MIPIDLCFAFKPMQNVYCLQIGAFLPTVERVSVIESFMRSKITSNVERCQGSRQIIKMYVVLSVN
jgi:hypothetical protein